VIQSDKFGVEARIRSFYPCRKKGHIVIISINFCVPDAIVFRICRLATMGLISAGRGRIYRHAKCFLALSSIGVVFLKPRLLNKRCIRTVAWSTKILWDESAGSRF
jgi:hypothetical protein